MYSIVPKPSTRGTLSICRRGKKSSIVQVALNRPKLKNAVNDDVYEDIIEVLRNTAKDDSVSALVLTGAGRVFSSGADLSGTTLVPESGRHSLYQPVGRFMTEWIAYPKILAAAVNGPAIGVGVTVLFHCDLVQCSSNASFWTPFTRISLVPEFSSSETMVAAMGQPKANEMLLLGKRIDAKTAVEWNICSRIVPDVDSSGDPIHERSLASHMCNEIDTLLLSLPYSDKTATRFVSMVRGGRRKHLQSICHDELIKMDERIESGEVAKAVQQIAMGSKGRAHRSKM